MSLLEIISLVAGIVILVSMLFRAKTFKTAMLMRSFNFLGNAIFVIYGIMINSIPVVVCNAGIMIVDIYFIIKEIKESRK